VIEPTDRPVRKSRVHHAGRFVERGADRGAVGVGEGEVQGGGVVGGLLGVACPHEGGGDAGDEIQRGIGIVITAVISCVSEATWNSGSPAASPWHFGW
jgi:hypothetical protein